MKTTILFIHGGNAYPSHDEFIERLATLEIDPERMRKKEKWHQNLQHDLGDDFDVFYASMPTSDDAQYDEWLLWFERVMEAIGRPVILVGHSLGAMFLVKYYSENEPKQDVPALFLVAGQHLSPDAPAEEQNSFTLAGDLSLLTSRARRVVFMHSTDDPVVPFESFETFRKEVPDAEFVTFTERGHFLDPTFPELITELKESAAGE